MSFLPLKRGVPVDVPIFTDLNWDGLVDYGHTNRTQGKIGHCHFN